MWNNLCHQIEYDSHLKAYIGHQVCVVVGKDIIIFK
jgi:hypothetical protein